MHENVHDEDRDDLAAFARGNPAGARRIIDRYSGPMLGHCTYLLGGDRSLAEDIVQECLLILWKKSDDLLETNEPLHLRAWLFRVLRNRAIDEIRKRKPQGELDEEHLVDDRPSPEAMMIKGERAQFALSLVNRLPERQRSALLMAHFEGMGNIEISQILGCTIEAVEGLLGRARRSLRGWAAEAIEKSESEKA